MFRPLRVLLCLILLKPECAHAFPNKERLHWTLTQYHYLEQVYKAYSNCVVHILDLTGNLELLPPIVPLVTDVWHREMEALSKYHRNSVEYKYMYRAVWDTRLQQDTSAVAKINNFVCFVTFLLVTDFQTSTDYGEIFRTESSRMFAMQTIMRQDWTLGWGTPWENKTAVGQYYRPGPTYFPESVVMLNIDYRFSLSQAADKLSRVGNFLYTQFSHLPTITVILVGRNTTLAEHRAALLFCIYCDGALTLVSLDEANAIGSAEPTISRYVNQVPWLNAAGFRSEYESELCPLTLSGVRALTKR